MNKFLLALLLSFSLCAFELPPEPCYQDLFVNGEVLMKGKGPDCAARYEAVRQVFDLYHRPFTLLDIGAGEGYFSFRAAAEYGAHVVMIDKPGKMRNITLDLCLANTNLSNVTLLSQKITAEDLETLAKAEHFDVVLALNIIHHFGEEWERAYDAIVRLGDHILIETPPDGDAGACGQPCIAPINERINRESFVLLGRFQRHTDTDKIDRLIWMQNGEECFLHGKKPVEIDTNSPTD